MPYYDYKVVVIAYNAGATEYMLCKLGDEGWELAAVDFDSRRYIFKKVRYHKNEDNKTEDQDPQNEGERA